MSPREDTIGIVHWDAMSAGTDGEQINLIIPAYFQAHHIPYLKSILASRLEGLLGPDVLFRLDPGQLTRSQTETRYDEGHIVITGIREPWPAGSALRRALEDAFKEAGSVEAEQMTRANELVMHLRST